MDRLLIDWRKAQAGCAYVVWVRDGETQRLLLTAEEIKGLGVDYTCTQVRIRLPIPPELERLSRRVMRGRERRADGPKQAPTGRRRRGASPAD